jgi:hypothetical protein
MKIDEVIRDKVQFKKEVKEEGGKEQKYIENMAE